jgi:hypothetical protein
VVLMTDIDEHLLAAAKLQEQKRGDLESPAGVHDHAGETVDDQHRTSLSFVESLCRERDDLPARFQATRLGAEVSAKFRTDRAAEAVANGEGTALALLTGITESDMSANKLTLHADLLALIENNGAPAFITACGNPNTGKTNTMLLLAELWKAQYRHSDALLVSNMADSLTDIRVTSAHELAVALLDHRDVPKFVVVDEASTHFDSRTNRREVAVQWTPLAKRFAKLSVEACGVIGHTGKDIHPEQKRLTTLAFYKQAKDVVEFFAEWPPDADHPDDRLFNGPLEDFEATTADYSADDASPWAWDLRAGLFEADLGWSELHARLVERGPAEDG